MAVSRPGGRRQQHRRFKWPADGGYGSAGTRNVARREAHGCRLYAIYTGRALARFGEAVKGSMCSHDSDSVLAVALWACVWFPVSVRGHGM